MKGCCLKLNGWGAPVMRLVLGVTLLGAFIPHLASPAGFVAIVQKNGILSEGLGNFYGSVTPYVAVILGVLLLLGWLNKLASGLAALLFLSFVIATGLFQMGWMINKDFAYLAAALALFMDGPGRWAIDSCHRCKGK